MLTSSDPDLAFPDRFSPLVLMDRLIALAEQADRAGMETAAGHLLRLAYAVCDEAPN
ncbi:MAG: hypothetical protein M0002_14660 [Rhodospirillales bacterium]|nr:hypothetical protein [Rhodospirillales bacterium]